MESEKFFPGGQEAQTRGRQFIAEDYKKHLDREARELGQLLKDEKINFGPTYRVITSQGEEIEIRSVFFEKQIVLSEETSREYRLFAQDSTRNLLGNRRLAVYPPVNEGSPSIVVGEIATAYRGKGIASAMELAANDLLQREAKRTNHEILWKVENNNLMRTNVEEQKRWQSMYGENGALGFDKKGEKRIGPVTDLNSEIEGIESILLTREKDRGVSSSETLVDADDAESIRAQRMDSMRRLTEDMKELSI